MTRSRGESSTFDHVGPRHLLSNRGRQSVTLLLVGLLCLCGGIGYLIGPAWATGVFTGGPALVVGAFLVASAAFVVIPVVADLVSPATLTLDDRGMTERVPLRGTRFYPWTTCRWFWAWQPVGPSRPERFARVAIDLEVRTTDNGERPWRRPGGRSRARRLLRANYGTLSASELADLLNRYQWAYSGPGLTYHDLEGQSE